MTELLLSAPTAPPLSASAPPPAAPAAGSALLPGERTDRELLADLARRPRVWMGVAAFMLVQDLVLSMGIYFRLQARGQPVPYLAILTDNGGVEWLSIVAMQVSAFVAGWFFPPRGRHWALRLATVGALLAATLVGRQVFFNWVVMVMDGAPWGPFRGQSVWIPGHAVGLMLYAGMGAALRAVLRERERRLAVARLEERVAHERFRALKTQLRPRFLFDTLAAVGERMHGDAAGAEQLLVRAGELLRLTFRHAEAERVALQQELAFAIVYLEIEGMRAGRPIHFRATADREAREAQVPHMSVFPLVESALLSAADGEGPGAVEVSARREGGRLRLDVRDDLAVPLAARRVGAGWAPVEALRARLDELPGAGCRLDFADLPGGGVRAALDVPLAVEGA